MESPCTCVTQTESGPRSGPDLALLLAEVERVLRLRGKTDCDDPDPPTLLRAMETHGVTRWAVDANLAAERLLRRATRNPDPGVSRKAHALLRDRARKRR